jgi:hypothetical protein
VIKWTGPTKWNKSVQRVAVTRCETECRNRSDTKLVKWTGSLQVCKKWLECARVVRAGYLPKWTECENKWTEWSKWTSLHWGVKYRVNRVCRVAVRQDVASEQKCENKWTSGQVNKKSTSITEISKSGYKSGSEQDIASGQKCETEWARVIQVSTRNLQKCRELIQRVVVVRYLQVNKSVRTRVVRVVQVLRVYKSEDKCAECLVRQDVASEQVANKWTEWSSSFYKKSHSVQKCTSGEWAGYLQVGWSVREQCETSGPSEQEVPQVRVCRE